jgi:hypothetical protein
MSSNEQPGIASLIVVAVGLVACLFCTGFITRSLIASGGFTSMFSLAPIALAVVLALSLLALFTLSEANARKARAIASLLAGVVMAALTFSFAFYYVLAVHPDWPQGPLLAVLAGGTIGFCGGAVFGFLMPGRMTVGLASRLTRRFSGPASRTR